MTDSFLQNSKTSFRDHPSSYRRQGGNRVYFSARYRHFRVGPSSPKTFCLTDPWSFKERAAPSRAKFVFTIHEVLLQTSVRHVGLRASVFRAWKQETLGMVCICLLGHLDGRTLFGWTIFMGWRRLRLFVFHPHKPSFSWLRSNPFKLVIAWYSRPTFPCTFPLATNKRLLRVLYCSSPQEPHNAQLVKHKKCLRHRIVYYRFFFPY